MTYDSNDNHRGRKGDRFQHSDRFDRARQPEEPRARHPRFGAGFGPEFLAAAAARGGHFGGAGFFPGGPGFDPRGGHGPRRRAKGDVRIAIIAILSAPETASLNGYAIMKAIGEQTEGGWTPSPGSVYPTLQQLVDEGLVTATGDGRSTEYSLTDDGRAFAAEHAEQLAGWANLQVPSDATRALFESAGKLMAALGQFRHAASDEQKTAAAARLDEVRKAIYLILAE